MGRNRTMHGALAASTAVVCVLSLAPPANGSGGGFSALLLEQSRCCPRVGAGESIAPGVACPPAGAATGGRMHALPGIPAPGIRLAGRDGAIIVAPMGAAAPGDGAAAGPRLAQSDAARQDTAPVDEEPPAEAPAESGTPSGEDAGEAFKGSPRPAGPDLTLSEERALISSGWK